MFFKKSNKIDSRIDTLIGAASSIQGDVHFSGGLRIDGAVRGNVQEPADTMSTLILSENGRIEGSVSAAKIVLNGQVVGPVKASQFIELQPKARITGDLHYKSLEMHTGAVIEGRLIYIGDEAITSSLD
ncbi:MAG TPA: polymer-forming cytoskeletal protein [Methylophilus sp.]